MKVFISYRRKDAQPFADRIYDWLEPEFGRDNVFKDVDNIPLGRDFRQILQHAVARCDVLLAVIGPRWLGETEAAGRRRVDDPGDWVRVEIETALARKIPVIPLLVDGAPLPREENLPPSLQELVYRNGMPLRPDPDFRPEMERLIKTLREMEKARIGQKGSWTATPKEASGPGSVASRRVANPAVSGAMKRGIIVGTIFIPIYGSIFAIIMGIIYMKNPNPDKKAVGKLWLYTGAGVFLLYLLVAINGILERFTIALRKPRGIGTTPRCLARKCHARPSRSPQ